MVKDLYMLSDALLYASNEEGFGLPVLEAGLFGRRVICSDLKVLREVGKKDVLYLDISKPGDIYAEKVIKFIEQDKSRRFFRRVVREYSWDVIFFKYLKPLLEE